MIIKLNWLRIENFKGIKDKAITFEGKDTDIYGDNATFKTTIMDAWLWLLFNKDSADSTNFTAKPQNALGQDIHHLQTEVEAELSVDGSPLKLKKMQEEKWETPRGMAEARLTGNTTTYWYNEVPAKAAEYKTKVDELIDENIFKMITNPLYFNTKLPWQKRREILLEISGDKTDEDVIASDSKLSKLSEILNVHSIEEYKIVVAEKLKALNKEKDDIPPRIDELTLSLPETEPDYTVLEAVLSEKKILLSKAEKKLTDVALKAEELSKLHKELFALKDKLEKTKLTIKSQINTGRTELIEKQGELLNGKIVLEQSIQALKSQIQGLQQQIEQSEKTLTELRAEWTMLNTEKSEIVAMEFEIVDIATHCPTCNQPLPVETVEDRKVAMKENFEETKKNKLEDITERLGTNKKTGVSTKEKAEQNKVELEEYQAELSEKQTALEKIESELSELATQLNEPLAEPDYTEHAEYNELVTTIEKLQTKVDKPVEDETGELLIEKASLQAEIDDVNKSLNSKHEIAKTKARIAELLTEEKRISNLIAELEGHKYLLEQFTVAKVNLLEDSINSQFKHVKFKLFDENITNEGIRETCIALVNTNNAYVPFQDANSAGRINAGIDVIRALHKFYDVQAPIFADNAESVTQIAETDAQLIRLIKPEIRTKTDEKKYSKLIVEVQ